MTTETPPLTSEDTALRLQDRFVRGFAWLRKLAGMTQSSVAAAAGWQQPYVARLEDARSPLLGSLTRLERYADACGFTTVLAFVDKETGAVVRTLNLGDAGDEAAERLLAMPNPVAVARRDRISAWSLRAAARRALIDRGVERS